MTTDRLKEKLLTLIKNYAGEGNDDFVNKLLSLIDEEKKSAYKKLSAKQEYVTYKKDGGHGVAVPMSAVMSLSVSQEK